jgi:pseudaminic acid synthase
LIGGFNSLGNRTLTRRAVKSLRPGFGLHPKYYNDILGKKVKFDLEKGTPLKLDLII